jgi:lysozyme
MTIQTGTPWLDLAASTIRGFEGCVLTAYPDPVSGGDPWTVGDGCTGDGIGPGTVWTQDQADTALITRLNVLGGQIDAAVTVPLNDEQKAALLSLAWNIGIGNFRGSTLLRVLNTGDYAGAAAHILDWNKAGGRVVQGLVNRRAAEQSLFNS